MTDRSAHTASFHNRTAHSQVLARTFEIVGKTPRIALVPVGKVLASGSGGVEPVPNLHKSLVALVKDSIRAPQAPARVYRILVVDDEEPVRKFVDRVFRSAGYETVVASDGRDAIEAARRMGHFDLLVTDVMMPQMPGDELARRLRQNKPSLKVLYLTGYSDRLFKERASLWQDEAFLDKPCSANSLREAVALLLFGRFEAPKEATS